MALRQRFHNPTVSPDAKKIRGRYMEAIRAGSSIADATDYANGKIEKVVKPKPKPVDDHGRPLEQVQQMPAGWMAPLRAPVAKEEFRKRGTLNFDPKPAPVAPMVEVTPEAVPVEQVVEPAPEAPAKVDAPVLPSNWEDPKFPWPKLRELATGMGCSANGRADAVASIKAKMIADATPVVDTSAETGPTAT